MNKLQNEREISKKELQLLLSTKLAGQLSVLESSTESLLPPGENFACAIFKVRALVKHDDDGSTEELHMVAKLFPIWEAVKDVFDFRELFKKEIFFYEKLIPALEQLEIQFDAKDDESYGIGPRIFGIRRSENPKAENVDEGVIILMENLTMKGYYTLDKVEGMDLDHSRMAIKSLARFHALNIACKQHRPHFFNDEVLAHAKVVPYRQNNERGNIFEILFNMMCKDSRIAEHRNKLENLMNPERMEIFFNYVAPEPWLSIAHFDFWTNNVMYHKNKEGKLDDLKFIDFQNYSYNSPMRDLPYFLCTSTNKKVMTENFNDLLDLYYDTFIGVLRKMKCDVQPFTRETFDAQLKIDASFEFFHNMLATKFFYAEINKDTYDPNDIESVVIFSDINKLGYDKWYRIIETYIKQDWL